MTFPYQREGTLVRRELPLRFTAYQDGTCLGRLKVEVSVGKGTSATNRGILPSLDVANSSAGEVSLQIIYDDVKKTFGSENPGQVAS